MRHLMQLLAIGVLLTLSGCYTRFVYTDDPPPPPVPYYIPYGSYYPDVYWHTPYLHPHRAMVRVPIVIHRQPEAPRKQVQGYQKPDPPRQATPPASNRKSGSTRSR